MEKRLTLAILLSTVVLFAYYSFLAKGYQEQRAVPQRGGVQREVKQAETAAPVVNHIRKEYSEGIKKTEAVEIAVAARDIPVDTGLFRLIFTSSGGRIKSCRLKKYKAKFWQQKEIQNAIDSLERQIASVEKQIALGKPQAEEQRDALIYQKKELLFKSRDSKLRAAKIEELKRLAGGSPDELIITEAVELAPDCLEGYPFTISLPDIIGDKALNTLHYESNSAVRGDITAVSLNGLMDDKLSIVKKLTFKPDTYRIDVELTFKNIGKETLTEKNGLILYGPGVGVDERSAQRGGRGSKGGIVCCAGGRVKRERAVKGFLTQPTLLPGVPKLHRNADWVALASEYFSAILIPHKGIDTARVVSYSDGKEEIGLCLPVLTLPPGKCVSYHFSLYLGPIEPSALENAGDGLGKIIDFGFWGPIAAAISSALRFFHRLVGNYGWAIILLSLLIKLLFYPLTHKSFESMSKMQEDMKIIQPKLQSLREKYKDNPQKLNKEMMNLYKKEGVNPLAGCKGSFFPMLLQMPIFFALYSVLYNSIELRQAPFLIWINDLSAPDPKKILPILMGVSMFFQQKVMSPTSAGTPEQQSQAKIMSWMMPVFLTYIFFGLPSGVVLYWFAFNIFTTAQQLLVKKKKALGSS